MTESVTSLPARTCHPGRENHCVSGACGECWLCRSVGPVAPSLPPMDPTSGVIWCTSCSEYYALAHQPLCPICLDERVKGIKGQVAA